MGLAFIDIVAFRQFQSTHGHQVGDAALRCVAAAIPVIEPHEWASRYDGDAFAVVLAISQSAQAENWGRAARAQIAAAVRHGVSATLDVHVAVAIGAPRWWPSDIHSQAVEPADAALHHAMTVVPERRVVVVEMRSET